MSELSHRTAGFAAPSPGGASPFGLARMEGGGNVEAGGGVDDEFEADAEVDGEIHGDIDDDDDTGDIGAGRRLSPRQELFCRAFAATSNGALAAREAGYAEAGIRQQAYRLLRRPAVRLRLRDLQQEVAEDFCRDTEALLAKLESIYRKALGKPSLPRGGAGGGNPEPAGRTAGQRLARGGQGRHRGR